MKLFVYGSLKPGGWANHLLYGYTGNMEDAWIVGAEIYDVSGRYPALNLESALNTDKTVHGIVYDITQGDESELLKNLDRLEGYPRLFDRDTILVETDSGPVKATIYFGVDKRLFRGEIVTDGVWTI